MDNYDNRLPIIESLILASPEPLPAKKIVEVVDDVTQRDIDDIVDELNIRYSKNDVSFRIRKIAGGYQSYITEDFARYVEDLFTRRRNVRLTRAALETLAITAYRQPVTKMDIEMIRGVASDSVINTLMQRKLVTLAGRAETVGKPLLYKTTDEFLKFFNLNSLDDLPRMEEIEELLIANEPTHPQQRLPLDGQEDGQEYDEEESSTPDLPPFEVPMGPFARPVRIERPPVFKPENIQSVTVSDENVDKNEDDIVDEEENIETEAVGTLDEN
ncbi:MAG: SMC-Scp complex subunit ScpB [Candidatus Zixiibacteriota bacterium]